MAVSLSVDFKKPKPELELNYESAAKIAVKVLKSLKASPLPRHTLLNLNVPDLPLHKVKGLKLVRQGFRFYSGSILRRKDHRGRDYYWVGGQYKGFRRDQDTDCFAVESGFASLTPLKLDSTDLKCLSYLENHASPFSKSGRNITQKRRG